MLNDINNLKSKLKIYFNKENYILLSVALIITFVLIYAFNFWSDRINYANKIDNTTINELNKLAPTSTDIYKLYDKGAKYTVINYFSLDCIHCRKAFILEDKMLSDLDGRVNIIYRHNPLASQELSSDKAVLSMCLYDKVTGSDEIKNVKYYNFLRDAFTNYNLYNINNEWVKSIAYKYVAKKDLDECLKSRKYEEYINKIKLDNTLSDIIFTPTVLLFKNASSSITSSSSDIALSNQEYVYMNKYNGITENGIVNLYKWLMEN